MRASDDMIASMAAIDASGLTLTKKFLAQAIVTVQELAVTLDLDVRELTIEGVVRLVKEG